MNFRDSSPSKPARVVQAYYPGNRIPPEILKRSFFRPGRAEAPHAATVAQRRSAPQALPSRPPHAAKAKAASVQRSAEASVGMHAFAPPSGFLAQTPSHSGKPMPPSVQHRMESFFGTDFSNVRIHVGPDATSIGAIAFTLGTDIHFAPGYYDPHSQRGQELLGHELTHVLQQREGRVANPLGDGIAVVQDHELEAEADRMGRAVASGQAKMTLQRRGLPFGGPKAPSVSPLQMRAAQAKGAGYRLIFGTYMHNDAELPEPLAGHSFVALEEPGGERHAFGFSPANYGDYDPRRDLGKLMTGVSGVVHDDASAFQKPGVKLKEWSIDAEQAQAAMAKVAEYQAGQYRFNLQNRQCSAFALDVVRAAKVETPVKGLVKGPRDVYKKL